MFDTDIINLAIMIIAKAYNGDALPITNTPSIIHPLEVGFILSKHDCSDKIISTAILRDALEKKYITFEDVVSIFGEETEALLYDCLQSFEIMSHDAKLIICADSLCHIRDTLRQYNIIGKSIFQNFDIQYYKRLVQHINNEHSLFGELKEAINFIKKVNYPMTVKPKPNFNIDLTNKKDVKVICFGMEGCKTCEFLKDIMLWLKEDGILIEKFDVDDELARSFDIDTVPTIKILYNSNYYDILWNGRSQTYKAILEFIA